MRCNDYMALLLAFNELPSRSPACVGIGIIMDAILFAFNRTLPALARAQGSLRSLSISWKI